MLAARFLARCRFSHSTAAAAATVAMATTLAQPAQSPAECGWFGKSKLEKKLEAENEQLKLDLDAVKEKRAVLQAEKDALANQKALKTQMTDMATGMGTSLASLGETGVPQNLSYGFVAGFCSGFAAKKAGKAFAVVAGGIYVGLQVLAFNGFIQINHDNIEDRLKGLADLNKDGKVDAEDLAIAHEKGMEILQFGVPSVGGFATGFAMGLRQG